MLKVGLTGGYATGKSFVAGELERLGCRVIYADKLGHTTLLPDGEAYGPAVEEFGSQILDADKTIDRKKLGNLVFGDPKRLAKLNGFVHPAVFRLEEALLETIAKNEPRAIAVVEAAILIETGRFSFFDQIILTTCCVELQIARGMKRDGLTREQVLERLSKQLPADEKKRFADCVIDTEGTKEETAMRVAQVFSELRRIEALD